MCMCVCIDIHTHKYRYTHTGIDTHTHTRWKLWNSASFSRDSTPSDDRKREARIDS